MTPGRQDSHLPLTDQEFFELLYEEWSEPVYRYLIHLIGRGGLAEDLFQDTWMKAIENHQQLRDHERFGPWLFRIARNLAFNQLRQHRRKGQVWILSNLTKHEDGEVEDLIGRQPGNLPDPRQSAIDEQRRSILQEVITDLEPQTQEMLQLRYFEHLTLPEVATVLGVPLGTVCTKIHRALKAIRGVMQARGFRELGAM